MQERKSKWIPFLLAFACLFALLAFQYLYHGWGLFTPSAYNSYTRQAMAWRSGSLHLPGDVPHLELAIFEGRYYVSFPPVPSLPIWLLTFLFGEAVPDGFLVMLYAFFAMLITWRLLLRHGYSSPVSSFWAFTLIFSSAMLPLVLRGAVWYQAQVLAYLLTIWSIERMDQGKPTASLLLYALAVGCRPFNAFYGPMLIGMHLCRDSLSKKSFKSSLRRLLPGILLGLAVASLYAWYNFARFGNPLEFGHNHLPEFSFQGGTQFSIRHIGNNIARYLFSLPFERSGQGLALKPFGFSLFLSNPILFLLLVWVAVSVYRREIKPYQAIILGLFLLHLFALLMHRTFGGYQYGARYAVDLIPYAVAWLLTRTGKSITIAEIIVMLLGFAFAVYGGMVLAV